MHKVHEHGAGAHVPLLLHVVVLAARPHVNGLHVLLHQLRNAVGCAALQCARSGHVIGVGARIHALGDCGLQEIGQLIQAEGIVNDPLFASDQRYQKGSSAPERSVVKMLCALRLGHLVCGVPARAAQHIVLGVVGDLALARVEGRHHILHAPDDAEQHGAKALKLQLQQVDDRFRDATDHSQHGARHILRKVLHGLLHVQQVLIQQSGHTVQRLARPPGVVHGDVAKHNLDAVAKHRLVLLHLAQAQQPAVHRQDGVQRAGSHNIEQRLSYALVLVSGHSLALRYHIETLVQIQEASAQPLLQRLQHAGAQRSVACEEVLGGAHQLVEARGWKIKHHLGQLLPRHAAHHVKGYLHHEKIDGAPRGSHVQVHGLHHGAGAAEHALRVHQGAYAPAQQAVLRRVAQQLDRAHRTRATAHGAAVSLQGARRRCCHRGLQAQGIRVARQLGAHLQQPHGTRRRVLQPKCRIVRYWAANDGPRGAEHAGLSPHAQLLSLIHIADHFQLVPQYHCGVGPDVHILHERAGRRLKSVRWQHQVAVGAIHLQRGVALR